MTRAIVFDLDGTLVDSAPSITVALNRIRVRRGATSNLAVETVKRWVSLGAEAVVRSALAEICEADERDLAEFRAEYAAIRTTQECLFDGFPETLNVLAAAGWALAVCSNKPQQLCVQVLEDTGISRYFSAILGGDAVPQSKPHPAHLLAALDALHAKRAASVYVGDSSIDLRTARAAGVPFLLATYGYSDPALQQLSHARVQGLRSPRDLPALLADRAGAPAS